MNRFGKPDFARRAYWGGTHASGDFAGKLWIKRVPLDRGGYTKGRNPQYFGAGAPLYRVSDEDDYVDFHVRAADREAAVADVRRMYPDAKVR